MLDAVVEIRDTGKTVATTAVEPVLLGRGYARLSETGQQGRPVPPHFV